METTTTTKITSRPMPKLWFRVPVAAGTAIQAAGVATGAALLGLAGAVQSQRGAALALMAAGWMAIYLCSHAVAHVAVGRAVGIRFRSYGVRGTDHPENYPPVVRQVMSALPMWSALTDRDSMRAASGRAKAAMFAAGETSTSLCSLLASTYAAHAGLPKGHALLVGTVLWTVASTITVTVLPKGDYAKALRALGWRQPQSAGAARQRSFGPNRRGPRGNELRHAVAGWGIANAGLIGLWAHAGGGFPWFAFVLVPSVVGVGSWARQGRREAAATQ